MAAIWQRGLSLSIPLAIVKHVEWRGAADAQGARYNRMKRSAKYRITGLCLALVLTGCVAEGDRPVPVVVPEPAYEELYLHYVELCAVSQFRSKGGDLGGVPGHAVMYLKGACRKADAPYPQLEMCQAPSDDPESLDHGVGISVNKMFKNINWMATPGRDLFFDGRLDPGETLTQDYYEATIQEAIERGLFNGIEIHDSYLENIAPERTVPEVVARGAIGTDFALRYARTVWCSRVPVTRAMMVDIVGYLNALNADYADGDTEYHWSGYADNCVHTLRNALAAADIWAPKKTWTIKLRQLFHLAIPANEVVNLAERVVEFPIDERLAVQQDAEARQSLGRYGWMPGRHGALLVVAPPYPDNELFDTTRRIFVLEGPLRMKTRAAVRMFEDERHTDLEANLRAFERIYEEILAGPPDRLDGFAAAYHAYIGEQLADARHQLAQLPLLRKDVELSGLD
jgi:hypothetical protein